MHGEEKFGLPRRAFGDLVVRGPLAERLDPRELAQPAPLLNLLHARRLRLRPRHPLLRALLPLRHRGRFLHLRLPRELRLPHVELCLLRLMRLLEPLLAPPLRLGLARGGGRARSGRARGGWASLQLGDRGEGVRRVGVGRRRGCSDLGGRLVGCRAPPHGARGEEGRRDRGAANRLRLAPVRRRLARRPRRGARHGAEGILLRRRSRGLRCAMRTLQVARASLCRARSTI